MDTGLVCRSGRIALYSGPGMRGCGEKWTYQDQQEQHFLQTLKWSLRWSGLGVPPPPVLLF